MSTVKSDEELVERVKEESGSRRKEGGGDECTDEEMNETDEEMYPVLFGSPKVTCDPLVSFGNGKIVGRSPVISE